MSFGLFERNSSEAMTAQAEECEYIHGEITPGKLGFSGYSASVDHSGISRERG